MQRFIQQLGMHQYMEHESRRNVWQKRHRGSEITVSRNIPFYKLHWKEEQKCQKHQCQIVRKSHSKGSLRNGADAKGITVRPSVHMGKQSQLQSHIRCQMTQDCWRRARAEAAPQQPSRRQAAKPPGKIVYSLTLEICDAAIQQAAPQKPP